MRGLIRGFLLCLAPGFLLLSAPVCRTQQPATIKPPGETICIRFLNGKSGKPVKGEFPNIWLGDSNDGTNPKTDRQGEVRVLVGNANPREIRVLPNYYFDCRNKTDAVQGRYINYSIDKIISEGMVGENLCGKQRASPIPGVLIVYIRPRTFMEKFLL